MVYNLANQNVVDLPINQTLGYTTSQPLDHVTNEILDLELILDVPYVIYYHGLMAAFSLFSIVANSLVVTAIVITPHLRTVSNYYIIALAIVGVLSAFFYTMYTLGSLKPSVLLAIGR